MSVHLLGVMEPLHRFCSSTQTADCFAVSRVSGTTQCDTTRCDQIFPMRLTRILCRTVTRLGELPSTATANTTASAGLRRVMEFQTTEPRWGGLHEGVWIEKFRLAVRAAISLKSPRFVPSFLHRSVYLPRDAV